MENYNFTAIFGEQHTLDEIYKTVTTPDGQIWKIGSDANSIDWAIPVGFPNASSPICRESSPEAYQELADLEH